MYESVSSAKTPGERYRICVQCPQFIQATTQCKKCWCIMKLKTKIPSAKCPIGKWPAVGSFK
jgi:hypothetical protein